MRSNITLAVKYRPKVFKDLVGNVIITKVLLNSIRTNVIRSAYFFSGGRGSGKTTSARIFGKAINCPFPVDGEPCNVCESCQLIERDRSTDFMEIDAASENSVQSIRDLSQSIQYMPSFSKKKIILLDESHALTVQASNALLKTLEEPPEHVVFMFCTTDPQKVLETIRSRTMQFQFQRLQSSEIVSRLVYICDKEKFQYEDAALNLISYSVNGGMRDAIMLLDQIALSSKIVSLEAARQVVGFISYLDLINLFSSIQDTKASIEWLNTFVSKNSPSEIVNSILQFIETLISVQNSFVPSFVSKDMVDQLKMLSSRFPFAKLVDFIGACFAALRSIHTLNLYDHSIVLQRLLLQFNVFLTDKQQVQQSGFSLLDAYKGNSNVKQQSKVELLKEAFYGKIFAKDSLIFDFELKQA